MLCRLRPRGFWALSFIAEDQGGRGFSRQGCGGLAAQISHVYTSPFGMKARQQLFRCSIHEWNPGDGPHGPLDDFGIEYLRRARGKRHIIDSKPIRQTQERTNISRILHPVQYQDPAPLRWREGFVPKDSQDPLRALLGGQFG